MNSSKFQVRLSVLNNLLFIAVLFFGVYLVIAPVAPQAQYAIRQWTVGKTLVQFQRTDSGITAVDSEADASLGEGNRLVIEKIGVDGEIFEGTSVQTLTKGIWRRPRSSTPDLGGNTVLVAHRFLYTSGPNTFYHLDKVEVGDRITLGWKGKRYDYEVREVSVVPPTELSIEGPTDEPMLTLYTCTPLFTVRDRLVVRAVPAAAEEGSNASGS